VLRHEIELRTEPLPESARTSIPPALQDLLVDPIDRVLLRALLDGRYSYRTVSSLAEEAEMEESDAVKHLERMREQSLAGKKITAARNLWFLTDKGCHWLEAQATGDAPPHDRAVN